MAKKSTSKTSGIVAAAAATAGVAAMSAAAYLLFGPKGKENRKNVKGWAVKMKGEIIEKFEHLKEVTAPVYEQAVNEVAEKFAAMQTIPAEEFAQEVAKIKKEWKSLVKHARTATARPAKKMAKKGKK